MHADQPAVEGPRTEREIAGPLSYWIHQFRCFGYRRRKIRVRKQRNLGARGQQARSHCIALAAVSFVANHAHAYPARVGNARLSNARGVVIRAVINHDQFRIPLMLVQVIENLAQTRTQTGGFVVSRHDNSQSGLHG